MCLLYQHIFHGFNDTNMVRTQLLLELCQVTTTDINKSQRQSLKKAVVNLGDREAYTGLADVCLRRAEGIEDLIAQPVPWDRLSGLVNSRGYRRG